MENQKEDKKRFLGIDIGGTEIKTGILDEHGKIEYKSSYPANFDSYRTPLMETALWQSRIFLKEHQLDASSLAGIGISATGQIDTKTGIVAGTAGHIDNWIGSPLKERFSREFGLAVTVINDANSAALAEQWLGAAKGYSDIIVVTIGTGIGGGVIVHSSLLEGGMGIAGELGHFSIDKNGIPCSCGNRGCYERYASTAALIRRARELYEEIPFGCAPEEINGLRIFELLEKGNRAVKDLVDSWIDDICTGLVSLIHIFNPEIILLGGGVSSQKRLFVDKVRERVLSKVMPQFSKNLKIESAMFTNDAGIIGAVKFFIDQNFPKASQDF